jgi:hypothetical protein
VLYYSAGFPRGRGDAGEKSMVFQGSAPWHENCKTAIAC